MADDREAVGWLALSGLAVALAWFSSLFGRRTQEWATADEVAKLRSEIQVLNRTMASHHVDITATSERAEVFEARLLKLEVRLAGRYYRPED